MNSHHLCHSIQILIVLCGRLAHAATEAGVTSQSPLTINTGPTNGEPFSPTTPGPGATPEPDSTASIGTSEVATPEPDSTASIGTSEVATPEPDSTASIGTSEVATPEPDSTASPTLTLSEALTVAVTTEAPSPTTVTPLVIPEVCLCDLTPDFCDIGCCCDIADCGVADLRTIFTGCQEKATSGVCIEKWLMFRANVDPSLVTVTDSLFCVRPEDNATASRTLPALPQYPALGESYHFSPPGSATTSLHTRDFYRADDVILTYFSKSSVRGLLRQPSPGAATAFCVNRNPAKFLRSVSSSCTRTLTPQSCTTDPNLSARSYYSDLSLIKIPVAETAEVTDLLIPVTPLSEWPAPSQQNNSCVNVVEKVEFVIGYTGRGELTYATVNMVLADVDLSQTLLQKHSVEFQLATPSPTQGGPIPAVGLKVGSPVIGRFDGEVKPLTVLGVLQVGECSSNPKTRAPILFTHNTITGCTFSSPSTDCSELRSELYGILQGLATPDLIAMNSGSQPDWTRVITQECSVSWQETCESGCVLPRSLSVQVLWARQGLLDLPQNYILGAKYVFHCHKIKCPILSSLALTTEVKFVDTTVYPEPPRGLPQPDWKFPFGFFTRGAAELDGQTASNGGDTGRVTWGAMLLTVMMLTGLEFLTR
ncbi:tectonic-3-like isoform X2 [Centroberyx affinis]|uniref:tectonic-3-like isoform X2 n=1 Tax=Centroberyx affinis TaxID=166261 RepID=UPI003A5BF084